MIMRVMNNLIQIKFHKTFGFKIPRAVENVDRMKVGKCSPSGIIG